MEPIIGETVESETPKIETAKAVINEITAVVRRLSNSLKKIGKAVEAWDFRTLDQEMAALEVDIKRLAGDWDTSKERVYGDVRAQQEFIKSDAYARVLEATLKDAGIPLKGEFPSYEFAPFKLTLSTGDGVARLAVGRKTERTTALSPQQVAAWAAVRYRGLVERKFDSQRFCRDLLEAYQIANKLAYGKNEVLWGRAVSLNTIYDLLTVTQSSKRDYPKVLYTYELARLKEQFEIRYKNYTFEFGFARNQAHALLLVDSKGRESRVSSLTIHKGAEEDENRRGGS